MGVGVRVVGDDGTGETIDALASVRDLGGPARVEGTEVRQGDGVCV